MQTAASSETKEPLWLALLFFMGGEVLITVPPKGSLPVYGRDEAGLLALEMAEALEDETDSARIKALCGIYFRSPVSCGDLSCYFLRHNGVTNHPEAVGYFIPSSLSWNPEALPLEA